MVKSNGHDDSEDPKIARFPDARERQELERRLKAANDRAPPGGEPILNLPPAVRIFCLVLIVIQMIVQALLWLPEDWRGGNTVDWLFGNFGFFVLRYTGDMPFGWQGVVSPFSHMLLHGGWLHVGVNVATLAAFGAGLEKKIGGRRMAALLAVTGIIGAFTHATLYALYDVTGNAAQFPHPEAPMIGISGGTSGLIGAILIMARDNGLLDSNRLAGAIAIILLSIFFFGYFGMLGVTGSIAWTTHLGGFVAGLLLYRPVARSKIFGA